MFGRDSISTAVKICGITTAEQADAIINLGADAIGLNFWRGSKRYLRPAEAAKWVPPLLPRCTFVAVVVNESLAQLRELMTMDIAHVFQLHGDEDAMRVARIMDLGCPVIKALQVRDRVSLKRIEQIPCDTILLDAYCPGLYGGEGKTFPWRLAEEAIETFPEKKFILAGGLTPENVAGAVKWLHPVAVDVASGVESSPGIKDLDKVKQFIDAVRAESRNE